MAHSRVIQSALLALALLGGACGGSAGNDNTEILLPYDQLAGGMIFASGAVDGSRGYELWWAPVPLSPTLNEQPVLRLTDAAGDQWQPSVSPGGQGFVYAARDDGIFLVTTSGRIRRITNTDGQPYKDSLPALSYEGDRVAWVREHIDRPVGDTGFFETSIYMANADGTDARLLTPTPNTVQDAPKFEPHPNSSRIVWSEFAADTLTVEGPQAYGIRVFDYVSNTDFYLCRGPVIAGGVAHRCFGQHLAWAINDAIVLGQSFLELYLNGAPATSSYQPLIESVSSQTIGAPVLEGPAGFYNAFPLSVSYQYLDRMVFDGLTSSVEGSLPTLGFYVAGVDGQNVSRVFLQGHTFDYDPTNTAGYFFSVATPQFVLPIQ